MAQGPARMVGGIEVIPLEDGWLHVAHEVFPDYDADTARAAAAQAGIAQDEGQVAIPICAFAIRTAHALVLVDTGSPPGFADGAGRFPRALAAAGIDPGDVTHLAMTHLHIDHVGGLVDDAGQAVFADAGLISGAGDWRFFFSDTVYRRADERGRKSIAVSRRCLGPYADRRREADGETAITSGVTMLPLPGHTPGHCGILVEDGGDQLLIWGDTIHSEALQLARPDWGVMFDVDADQARATRKALFDRVATDGLTIAGPHLMAPQFARLERAAQGYRLIRDA